MLSHCSLQRAEIPRRQPAGGLRPNDNNKLPVVISTAGTGR